MLRSRVSLPWLGLAAAALTILLAPGFPSHLNFGNCGGSGCLGWGRAGFRLRGSAASDRRQAARRRHLRRARFLWRSEAGRQRCLRMLEDSQVGRYDASCMDWTWWQANIQHTKSKIDVVCRECGHRSKDTSLKHLQSGRAPGCFCNGAVRWSTAEGHARCLAMLKDRYGEQYDSSCMDWTWWQANIEDAKSKIDVVCRECGHRSKDTSLGNLRSGQAPGCFCNGAVRWSTAEGHARCFAMLKDRYGEQYDASCMDWTWWQANIQDTKSKIDVVCRECGHRSKDTSLNNLQSGQAPGCFCNGAVRWSTAEGHARCFAMLKDRYGEQYDASCMDWTWWQANIEDTKSKIDVVCRECGHRSKDTSLNHLQSGQAPGCFCNGAVRWSTAEGHARCLAMLKDRYGEQYDASCMDWTWWQANIQHTKSKIDVVCRECGHRSKDTSLNHLQSGQAPGCFCNGAVRWSTAEGHARCFAMLKDRYGEQYDASCMDWTWWQANIEDTKSKIDVVCRECGHRSKDTLLNSLQSGQAPGCLCSRKTEAKLERWMHQAYPDATITSQITACTNPATGRTMRFDFGLDHKVLIELDGNLGHFGFGWGGRPCDQGVANRDLLKEQWATLQHKVVIRLLQEDVYCDRWAWQDFLKSAIQHAIQNSEPCVITQDARQYKTGIYRKLRRALSREVGHFLLSDGAEVNYLRYDVSMSPKQRGQRCALSLIMGSKPIPSPELPNSGGWGKFCRDRNAYQISGPMLL